MTALPQIQEQTDDLFVGNKICDIGFNSATWDFLEASHEKVAADGIVAVIKRSADRFVNEGGNIMGSDDLIVAMESKGTSVKLVKNTEDKVSEIEEELSTALKPKVKTQQTHQVYNFTSFLCYIIINYN